LNAIVVDTNIVVMMIRGDEEYETFTGYLEGNKQVLSFATIAEMELWFLKEKENLPNDALIKWEEFKAQCEVVHTSDGLIARAAQLAWHLHMNKDESRRRWHDIWIAATALELGIPVVTNDADFQKFKPLGLQVLP